MGQREYYESLHSDEEWVRGRYESAQRALRAADEKAKAEGFVQNEDGFWYWGRDRLASRVRKYAAMLNKISLKNTGSLGVVYSKDLSDRYFQTYMDDGRYKPYSFCPICKSPNSRIGAHLVLSHRWSEEQARGYYRMRIAFVHSLAPEADKIAAQEFVKEESY